MQQLDLLADLCELSLHTQARKDQGVYYTPASVARYMVDESLRRLHQAPAPPTGLLFDPACGAGRLLWLLMIRQHQRQPQAPLRPWFERLLGVDLDPVAVQVTRFGLHYLWALLAPNEGDCPAFQVLCQDAFAVQGRDLKLARLLADRKLSLIISNPPYLGEKNNQDSFQALKSGYWKQHYRGRGDLYYYFFHLALDLSHTDTLNCLLTPAYFTQATAAHYLRQRLHRESRFIRCVDFGNWRLFSQAPGLQSFLCWFQQSAQDPVEILRPLQPRFDPQQDLRAQLQLQHSPHQALFQSSQLRIRTQQGRYVQELTQALAQAPRVQDFFQVRQGIVSGADRLSKRHLSRCEGLHLPEKTGIFVLSQAEAQLLLQDGPAARQTAHTPAAEAQLVPWFKNSQIVPFVLKPQIAEHLIYAGRDVQQLHPVWAAHLTRFRALLEQRREVQQGRIPWWQLQWPRSRELFEAPALVLPQRAKILRASLSPGGLYASADVYFIQDRAAAKGTAGAASEDSLNPLQKLCMLLNSPLYSYWFYFLGKRKGSMLELYQEPLRAVPFPQIHADRAQWERVQQLSLQLSLPQAYAALHQWICRQLQVAPELESEVWDWFSQRIATS